MSSSSRRLLNRGKALQALLYAVSRLPQPANIYNVLKCIWFADRQHLEQYGRQIYGERYFAPKYGPVPSYAYRMVKYAAGREFFEVERPEILESFTATKTEINARKEPVLDELSRSELICLNEAIKKYGTLSFPKLKRISHKSKAFLKADLNGDIEFEDIIAELKDSSDLKQHIFGNRHPGSAEVK